MGGLVLLGKDLSPFIICSLSSNLLQAAVMKCNLI